jgi:uncharacterized protein YcfL
MIKLIILFITLLISSASHSETLIIPIQDLLFEVPNFDAPKFNINQAVNGQYDVKLPEKQKRSTKNIEKKMIRLAYDIYPDAQSIRIFNGNFIIKLD